MFPPRGILLLLSPSPPSLSSSSFQVKFRALFLLLNRCIYIYTCTSVIQPRCPPTDTNFSPLIPYFLVGTTKRSTWIVEINYRSRYFTRMIYLAALLARNRKFVIVIIVNRGMHVDRVIDSAFFDIKPFCLTNFPLTDFPNSRTNVGIISSSPPLLSIQYYFFPYVIFRTFIKIKFLIFAMRNRSVFDGKSHSLSLSPFSKCKYHRSMVAPCLRESLRSWRIFRSEIPTVLVCRGRTPASRD